MITTISDKNYGKICYLDSFVFLSPSPSEQSWGRISEASVNQCYGFGTLSRGTRGILNALFQFPIIFCHWLSEIKKKKERGGLMHAISHNSDLL